MRFITQLLRTKSANEIGWEKGMKERARKYDEEGEERARREEEEEE